MRLKFWIVESLNVQGRAKGSAVIASGGLNENAVEKIAALDKAVAGAVQRNAAGEAEVFMAGLASEVPQDMELAGLQNGLQGGSEIFVQLGYVGFGFARRPEFFGEEFQDAGVSFLFFACMVLGENWKGVSAVVSKADELHYFVEETARVAIRREAHDFVFVGIDVEP
jgi:hypothetical protein